MSEKSKMYEYFLKVANVRSNRTAINNKKESITYGQLNEYVNKLTRHLNHHGIISGTSVGLVLVNSILNVISVLALSNIKAKMMFFHPKMTAQECQKIGLFSPEYIIFDENEFFITDNTFSLADYEKYFSMYLTDFRESTIFQMGYKHDMKGSMMFFSSGSAGNPKGIVKTEEQILEEAGQIVSTLGIKECDRIVCSAQLCHSYGFMFGMTVPLLNGCEITYTDPIILVSKLESLLKSNTIFIGLPTHYRLLCEYSNQKFGNIRIALSGGSAMSLEEKNKIEFLDIQISNIYGMSETGALMIENNKYNDRSLFTYPYRLITGVEMKLDYNESYDFRGQFAYELLVKTNALCVCIIDDGKVKENYFDQWFPTGDLVVTNEKGFHIVGRKDLTINVGGKKVNPFEIEFVLKGHPSVNEAIVYGISDVKRGQVPIALVTVKQHIDKKELFDLCREKLSVHKIPQNIEVRSSLPTSSMGKILRKIK
ncbi:class I adenylate-forming enzyme family protein [Photorhabdus africana]|uniref:class I adenylate-forming enzyme family protein n=1 Tax=Photorhabdus africana TaxID=3097554 RepID=UPI002B404015|nr:class I adenylate-forming enzyme family protein [Photorhabdus sp. CRI-LC]